MDKQQRREAAAAYKARLQQGGVFQIRNTKTGRILLRRTTDLPCRPNGAGTEARLYLRCSRNWSRRKRRPKPSSRRRWKRVTSTGRKSWRIRRNTDPLAVWIKKSSPRELFVFFHHSMDNIFSLKK